MFLGLKRLKAFCKIKYFVDYFKVDLEIISTHDHDLQAIP